MAGLVRAQQPMPVIGFLHASLPEASPNLVAAFRKGVGKSGYVEGANVTIEYRWAQIYNAGCPNWPPIWSVVEWR